MLEEGAETEGKQHGFKKETDMFMEKIKCHIAHNTGVTQGDLRVLFQCYVTTMFRLPCWRSKAEILATSHMASVTQGLTLSDHSNTYNQSWTWAGLLHIISQGWVMAGNRFSWIRKAADSPILLFLLFVPHFRHNSISQTPSVNILQTGCIAGVILMSLKSKSRGLCSVGQKLKAAPKMDCTHSVGFCVQKLNTWRFGPWFLHACESSPWLANNSAMHVCTAVAWRQKALLCSSTTCW